jgi:hypothetical protein
VEGEWANERMWGVNIEHTIHLSSLTSHVRGTRSQKSSSLMSPRLVCNVTAIGDCIHTNTRARVRANIPLKYFQDSWRAYKCPA